MAGLPILYSFRRCPYAMRARLAIAASGEPVELREVVLRDKPAEMLEASPKATVPVLVLADGSVLEESRDIMDWALAQNDPERLIDWPAAELEAMRLLIETFDGPLKMALDRYKYATRYADADETAERAKAAGYLAELEVMLDGKSYLFGERMSLADMAILPFVRQYAHVDIDWFRAQDWPNVIRWLDAFLVSDRLDAVMAKYEQWKSGERGVLFPAAEGRV
ncbi:MAG: glutathione S-transferase [Nitratireductor sp.]|nr:glutathione S-transferase [Nitratireductor sp.]